MKTVILVCGVPGSGKTTLLDQVGDKFERVRNDDHIGGDYVTAIAKAAARGRPIIAEAPFSISKVKDPLERAGYKVIPVFIVESEPALRSRWAKRGTSEKDQRGHLTRQETYLERARAWGAFAGRGDEVLQHLQALKT